MKILITGAMGGLGSHTIEALHQAKVDCEIVATDKGNRYDRPGDFHEMSLLDEAGVAGLMQGIDAVVHLGNHTGPGWGRRSNATTFNENVAMNNNIFDAAVNVRVKKIIFASSIQVIASEHNHPADPANARRIAYLPLDAHSPANPSNCYALSKQVGELLLEQYAQHFGIQCASLRLPRLFVPGTVPKKHVPFDLYQPLPPTRIAQAFGLLSYPDAARAIVALLTTDLPGHRVYLPAKSEVHGALVRPTLEKFYPGVPLNQPPDQLTELIDHRRITADTGWMPLDPLDSILSAPE